MRPYWQIVFLEGETELMVTALFIILVAGFFACFVLDVFGRLLLLTVKLPEPAWNIVGRWTYYMCAKGQLFHPAVSQAAPVRRETELGWAFHYFIAVGWAVIFHLIFIAPAIAPLSWLNGFVFGVATAAAPLLIFMPFTGQGTFARNTLTPLMTSAILLVRHSVFGLAMHAAFIWFY